MRLVANNFTAGVLLMLVLTVIMMGVRVRKPVDNNWLLLYWLLTTVIIISRPEKLGDVRIVGMGLIAGLLLRFEFMNRALTVVIMGLEMVAFLYILYRGYALLLDS